MKFIFASLATLLINTAFSQYRYDNVLFKTVYWDELCQTLKQNPDHLILDVRSKGEHYDTSMFKGLNIGHLKGAINININEVGSRLKEIEAYKNRPVFVYCSHSQRSRRVSKLLADSGFVNVFNINGGVSNLRMFGYKEECDLLRSDLPYQIISPKALAQNKKWDYYILDVRTDSLFKGISTVERRNALGRFKNSINIPLASIEQNLASIPKDKKILVIDENGSDSPAAAGQLAKNGFANVFILFNGLDSYTTEVPEKERTNWESNAGYHMINAWNFDELMKKNAVTVVDVRTADEFNNRSKDGFRNIGAIKGAVNIPYADWDKQITSVVGDKEKPVVVYAMSNTPEIFEAAKKLSAQGYKNVNVLLGGLFNLRWRAANLKGHSHLNDWVVNVPADNM